MSAQFLSPVVKRLLAEHRLEPDAIPGTGADGRITKRDVLAHIERAPAAPAQNGATGSAALPAAQTSQSAAPPAAQAQPTPFSPIRRVIAEHMVRSLATSAHTLVVIEVDYARVDQVRQAAKASFREAEGFGLTYLPFIAHAVTRALADYPEINATVVEDPDDDGGLALHVHPSVALGIAVDLDFKGLIVPVIRGAQDLTLTETARSIADVARRALDRKLTNDDLVGGTFTLTNAGGYGTLITGPIINQPQVAILSTDGVKVRPVAVPNELTGGHDLAFHPIGNLALSFDHRAFDGAYASAFLARVREILEEHDWQETLIR